VLASAALAAAALAQQPLRLLDRIEAPLLYVALDAASAEAGFEAAPGSVRKLLADPAFDRLFGAVGEPGRARTLVRGVLAKAAGEIELAMTGIAPSGGQPLLVLRARLHDREAARLRGLLDGTADGGADRGLLARQHRRLGPHQTYAFASDSAADGSGPDRIGKTMEVAVVDDDLVVANDGTAMHELLAPADRRTTAVLDRLVLATDPRFRGLRQRLPASPGSLFVYCDWLRLGQRVRQADGGIASFLLAWSGLGSARAVMASLSAAEAGAGAFSGTVLLDFDRAQDAAPARDAARAGSFVDGADVVDGWFAAAQGVPARSLLAELPGGGLGGLVVAVDLSEIAARSRRGASFLRLFKNSFQLYGLDFDRHVLGRLGSRGAVQLLFKPGADGNAAEVVSVYALRAKTKDAAADLFRDLERAVAQRGFGRLITAKDRRGPDVLEVRHPHDGDPVCVAALDDLLLVAFDDATLVDVHDEHRRAAKARGKRDAAVTTALQAIGGDKVTGLFDLDLQPLLDGLATPAASGEPLAPNGIPRRHTGYLDLQPRDGGVVVRVRVLSSR
jgi:hypothetical protein